eukprot:NODE_1020_length_2597_cov_0.811849.p1 type:complete len:520 gc:universal NODE_1020_length_2597_cov_0.811849:2197-638(-)
MFDKNTNIHLPQMPALTNVSNNAQIKNENWTHEFNAKYKSTPKNTFTNSSKEDLQFNTNAVAQNSAYTQQKVENIDQMVMSNLDSKLDQMQVKETDQVVNENLWSAANEILNSQDAKYLNNTEFIKFVKQIKNKEIELVDNEFVQKKEFKEGDYIEDFEMKPTLEQGFDTVKADLDQWTEQYQKNLDQNEELTKGVTDEDWNELQKDYLTDNGYVDNGGYGYTFEQVRHRYPPYSFKSNNEYLVQAPAESDYIEKLYDVDSSMNESIKALEAAVQLTNDAFSWFCLGIRHYENESDLNAIYALRKCVEREPMKDAYAALAVVYANENFRLDAYDAINHWLDLNPEFKDVPYTKTSRVDESLSERLQNCLELNPIDADLNVMMGVLSHSKSDFEKAVECFSNALKVRPDDHKIWNKLGATYANSHRLGEARNAYFKALDLHPSFIRARYNLAVACVNDNNYREAVEHVLQALKIQSQEGQETSDSLWSTLKMACLMLNRTDLASKCDEKELGAFKSDFIF